MHLEIGSEGLWVLARSFEGEEKAGRTSMESRRISPPLAFRRVVRPGVLQISDISQRSLQEAAPRRQSRRGAPERRLLRTFLRPARSCSRDMRAMCRPALVASKVPRRACLLPRDPADSSGSIAQTFLAGYRAMVPIGDESANPRSRRGIDLA
ncbi:hypothetical protein KM043_017940 [Ampulex compressa]|nr:hypothetical protein KM043_017940 [Ampulex compressa]